MAKAGGINEIDGLHYNPLDGHISIQRFIWPFTGKQLFVKKIGQKFAVINTNNLKVSKQYFGISIGEALLIGGSYSFFALLYYSTLWLNRGGFKHGGDPYFNLKLFLNWGGIDYLLKFILSLPVWWLIFKKLRHFKLYQRLLVHCLTLPVYVFVWQKLYYLVTESLGMFHLSDLGQVWDIYITALFYVLQFGVLHAYIYFKDNQQKQKLEAVLREAALKSELAALKAQLNPHFLYNVFNTINASVPPELEKTRNMIAELSDLFRYQLRASVSELVPLRDELDFTRKYLDLEKARFEERLQIVMQVDEAILDVMVPPMLLQPLVENAVRHGIAPLIRGGAITISIKKIGKQLAFCIADTGVGIENKTAMIGKGIGLTNTALRLKKMYGTSMGLTDNIPHGLVINFTTG